MGSMVLLQKFCLYLKKLLALIASHYKQRPVIVFAASDSKSVVSTLRQTLPFRVVQSPGVPVHNRGDRPNGTKTDELKIWVDWYMLALSTFLFSPVFSTFSTTANAMGMQRFAVVGRGFDSNDYSKLQMLFRNKAEIGWR